jgi:hypothetical protein
METSFLHKDAAPCLNWGYIIFIVTTQAPSHIVKKNHALMTVCGFTSSEIIEKSRSCLRHKAACHGVLLAISGV